MLYDMFFHLPLNFIIRLRRISGPYINRNIRSSATIIPLSVSRI